MLLPCRFLSRPIELRGLALAGMPKGDDRDGLCLLIDKEIQILTDAPQVDTPQARKLERRRGRSDLVWILPELLDRTVDLFFDRVWCLLPIEGPPELDLFDLEHGSSRKFDAVDD